MVVKVGLAVHLEPTDGASASIHSQRGEGHIPLAIIALRILHMAQEVQRVLRDLARGNCANKLSATSLHTIHTTRTSPRLRRLHDLPNHFLSILCVGKLLI